MKQLYEQQNNVNASNATGTDVNESRLREEMKENTSDMLEDHPSTQDLARGNQVLSTRMVFQHIGGILLHFFTKTGFIDIRTGSVGSCLLYTSL